MTPAETIQAAIDKLIRLRNTALPGPLEVDTNYPFSSDIVGIFAPDAKAYAIKAEAASGGDWDEDYDAPLDNNDAPHRPTLALLVTLHATFAAQLAILTAARVDEEEAAEHWAEQGKPHLRGPAKIVPINRAALTLARAILGEQVDA